MGISKFNVGGARVDWELDTKDWEIKKLRELDEGKTYLLKGFFSTKDNGFGIGAILISDGFLVSIPGRYADIIKDMLNDAETVAEVKAGKCGFKYSKVDTNKGNPAFVVEFLDL